MYIQKDAPFQELSDAAIRYLEMYLEGSLRKDSAERIFPAHPHRRRRGRERRFESPPDGRVVGRPIVCLLEGWLIPQV